MDGEGKSDGKFDHEILVYGRFYYKNGETKGFEDLEHLAVDREGNVYVSNRAKNNIQVFKPAVD